MSTDQQISLILQRTLIDAFGDFSKEIRKFCSQEEDAASIPLTVTYCVCVCVSFVKKINLLNRKLSLTYLKLLLSSTFHSFWTLKNLPSRSSWLRASFLRTCL